MMVAVRGLAWSEAISAATLPTSARVGRRSSSVNAVRAARTDWLAHVGKRDALDVVHRDRVERDVQAAGARRDRVSMPAHHGLVQGVDDRGLGGASGLHNVVRHGLQRREGATGEEDGGALSRERSSNSAADRTAGAVHHRVLSFQQHRDLLSGGVTI
jgi:hypothetical protein